MLHVNNYTCDLQFPPPLVWDLAFNLVVGASRKTFLGTIMKIILGLQSSWRGLNNVVYTNAIRVLILCWASDWGWIEQTLNSRRSPLETEVFLSLC